MRLSFIIFFLTISTLFSQQQADSVEFYVQIGDPSP